MSDATETVRAQGYTIDGLLSEIKPDTETIQNSPTSLKRMGGNVVNRVVEKVRPQKRRILAAAFALGAAVASFSPNAVEAKTTKAKTKAVTTRNAAKPTATIKRPNTTVVKASTISKTPTGTTSAKATSNGTVPKKATPTQSENNFIETDDLIGEILQVGDSKVLVLAYESCSILTPDMRSIVKNKTIPYITVNVKPMKQGTPVSQNTTSIPSGERDIVVSATAASAPVEVIKPQTEYSPFNSYAWTVPVLNVATPVDISIQLNSREGAQVLELGQGGDNVGISILNKQFLHDGCPYNDDIDISKENRSVIDPFIYKNIA